MSDETTKAVLRRLHDAAYATTYFVGRGIDIGAGRDGLGVWQQKFPLIESCYAWDLKDGDAQAMVGVQDGDFDFVHSAHCLEHMRSAREALLNWWRILRPGGHLVVIVPDADLYEQNVWPSTFNPDHKARFTMRRLMTASKLDTHYMPDLIPANGMLVRLLRLEQSFYFGIPRADQTSGGLSESAIEMVVRKPDQDQPGPLNGYDLNDEDRAALKGEA